MVGKAKNAGRSTTVRQRAPQAAKEASAETTPDGFHESDPLSPHHVLPVTVPCTVYMQVAECATETGLNPSEQFLRGIELFFNESKTHPSKETSQEPTMAEGTPEIWTAAQTGVPVVQFSTRIALPYREVVRSVADKTGQTVRSVIENALAHTYGVPEEMR